MRKRKTNESKTDRASLLIQYLKEDQFVTLDLLAKKLNVSARTVQRYIKLLDQPKGYIKHKWIKGKNETSIKVYRIFEGDESSMPYFTSEEILALRNCVLINQQINISTTTKKKLERVLHFRNIERNEYREVIKFIETALVEKKQFYIQKYMSRDIVVEENIYVTPVYIDYDDNKVYAYIRGNKHLRPYKFESMYGVEASVKTAIDFSIWQIEKEKRDLFTFPYKSSKEVIKVDITFNSFVQSQLIRQFPQLKAHVKPILGSTDHFELKIDVYDIAPIGRFVFGLIGVIKINSKHFKSHLKQYFDKYIKDGIGAFVNLSN